MPFKASISLLCFFCLSCSNEGGLNSDPVKYFKSIERLEGDKIMAFDDYEVYRPVSFVMNEEYIYVQNRDENMICVVNREAHEMETLLKRGQGPGEAINIGYITASDDAAISLECNKQFIIEIPFHSNKVEFTPLPLHYGAFTSIIKVQEGYVMLGNFKEGRYMYYKPSEEKTMFFGDYRVHYKYRGLDNFTKSLIYISSKLAVKPDMTRFVAINFNNGVIDINGIDKDTIVNLKKLDFHYQDVYVEGNKDIPRVSIIRSNKNGFFDVAASDEHIYAIYSGKSFEEAGIMLDHCDYLMVFDWDGNPAGCYKLNAPLYAISYSIQEKALFGIHLGEEAILYKYKLSLQDN